jgi:ArsR family transcriptional regulator, cadmium/lead-responsive transcriptional repressor
MAKLFRGLGDPTRLRVLLVLEGGERSVGQLVDELQIPQGRMSSHLACLRWCGFVQIRRDQRRILYRLADARVREMLRLAEAFLTEHGEHIELCRVIDQTAAG